MGLVALPGQVWATLLANDCWIYVVREFLPRIQFRAGNSIRTIAHKRLAIPLVAKCLQARFLSPVNITLLLGPRIIRRIEQHTERSLTTRTSRVERVPIT